MNRFRAVPVTQTRTVLLTIGILSLGMRGAMAGGISAIWANEGGDKVARAELRASANPAGVTNAVWDGAAIRLHGARNELLGFALIIEAAHTTATHVAVHFDKLTGPDNAEISSLPIAEPEELFTWTNRPIELFYVRYLEIRGLSRLSYDDYDERHIPERLRRPWTGNGHGEGAWTNRPDHNALYPDIAVPLELETPFEIPEGMSQIVWMDVYIPKSATPGAYTGQVNIVQNGLSTSSVPVSLHVRRFALPDVPTAKTMVYLGYGDINRRYLDDPWPAPGTDNEELSRRIRDRHFLMAHRHKLSLIDNNPGAGSWPHDRPRDAWGPRLNGSLFTAENGYDGPGSGVGNGVYSIGTYGSWPWKNEGQTGMWAHADRWVGWFTTNAPETDAFLYLIDESSDYAQTEQWAAWAASNPGPGSNLLTFATIPLPAAAAHTPSLNIPASWLSVGVSNQWETLAHAYRTNKQTRFHLYNGKRPASGSFSIEDDGVALRSLAWTQYKKRIDRWFFWESTYYNNFQGGMGETRVFQSAFTFGSFSGFHATRGDTGWNYSNGDGVLFYPGTDRVFPEDSYEIPGPFASLRLKLWRRGIQDVDYLRLAARHNPERVQELLAEMVPRVLWEHGVDDPNDPTWVRTDISWPTDPNRWEAARSELGDIIEQAHDQHVLSAAPEGPAPESPVLLTWPSLGPGFRYRIETSPTLVDPTWTTPSGEWPVTSTNWIHDEPTGPGVLYYRLAADYFEVDE